MDDCISRKAAIDCLNNVSFDCSMDQECVEEELLKLPSVQPEQRWILVTETPPRGDDLMLKVHDRRCHLDNFNYYVMGFHDGREFQTYLFRHQDDHDIEIVGWMLCPWKGEE